MKLLLACKVGPADLLGVHSINQAISPTSDTFCYLRNAEIFLLCDPVTTQTLQIVCWTLRWAQIVHLQSRYRSVVYVQFNLTVMLHYS